MTPTDLGNLASSIWGPEWQTPLSRERGIAIRTVQRWAKEGIPRATTALAILAYLKSRRVIDIPMPEALEDADRDDEANVAMVPIVASIIDAGRAVGWHDAELLCALMAATVDRMVDGAGIPAALDVLDQAASQLRARVDS